jgi:GTP-binding protein
MIRSARFLVSNSNVDQCPKSAFSEYAFIGRSNVGKSSLINSLTNHKKLAKTSGTPGKTQLINHFLINDSWHLVDLPGYGYARASKKARNEFKKLINDYFSKREQLVNTFVLIDSRHQPQEIDVNFIGSLGKKGLPFSLVFTKQISLQIVNLRQTSLPTKNNSKKMAGNHTPLFLFPQPKQEKDEMRF